MCQFDLSNSTKEVCWFLLPFWLVLHSSIVLLVAVLPVAWPVYVSDNRVVRKNPNLAVPLLYVLFYSKLSYKSMLDSNVLWKYYYSILLVVVVATQLVVEESDCIW